MGDGGGVVEGRGMARWSGMSCAALSLWLT